jgi:beta-barrel assembly-enhancing protease
LIRSCRVVRRVVFILCLLSAQFSSAQSSDIRLPSLGEGNASGISLELEKELGASWLRSYYRQTPLNRDYLLQDYIENLVARLKPYGLTDYALLQVLVVDNPTMNAFAVPGGVIGIHSGLLLHADSEDEVASVIAHEMAHISQRHFARSVAQAGTSGIATMAGLLAAIVLGATAGGDASLAMLAITQGASLESQLRYSRQNETESDRIGQQTLVKAGFDPAATARMFEKMLAATRYTGDLAPEYLLSHPLPQSRVIDAQTRSTQYPTRIYPNNPQYQLLATRVKVANAETSEIAVRNFGNAYHQAPNSNLAKYAYALSLQGVRRLDEAFALTEELLVASPDNLVFQSLYLELLLDSDRAGIALEYLQSLPSTQSENHVLRMQLAETYNRLNEFEQSAEVLEQQTGRRPSDPIIWYELAESYGLAGDIYNLHLARSKYFELVGSFNQSMQHIRLAKRELGNNPIEQAVLDQRIRRIAELQSQEMDL